MSINLSSFRNEFEKPSYNLVEKSKNNSYTSNTSSLFDQNQSKLSQIASNEKQGKELISNFEYDDEEDTDLIIDSDDDEGIISSAPL